MRATRAISFRIFAWQLPRTDDAGQCAHLTTRWKRSVTDGSGVYWHLLEAIALSLAAQLNTEAAVSTSKHAIHVRHLWT